MYALRDVTSTVRSLALQTSSIMSKKIAERPDSLVLDVKFGKGSFQNNVEESIELAKSMIQTGELCGIHTTALITRMDSVLGYTVGNWLEVRECIEIMKMGDYEEVWKKSSDLIEVTLALAGQMLVQGGKAASIKEGVTMAKEHLMNGKAWKKFQDMVEVQGGDLSCINRYPDAMYSSDVYASQSGWVESIDSMEIGLIGVLLGAGRKTTDESVDFSSGMEFHARPGMKVKKGDLLATVYTERAAVLEGAVEQVQSTYTFSVDKPALSSLITHFINKDAVEEFDQSVFVGH
jgi:pyrimidine-nucleoside phosphorylase